MLSTNIQPWNTAFAFLSFCFAFQSTTVQPLLKKHATKQQHDFARTSFLECIVLCCNVSVRLYKTLISMTTPCRSLLRAATNVMAILRRRAPLPITIMAANAAAAMLCQKVPHLLAALNDGSNCLGDVLQPIIFFGHRQRGNVRPGPHCDHS